MRGRRKVMVNDQDEDDVFLRMMMKAKLKPSAPVTRKKKVRRRSKEKETIKVKRRREEGDKSNISKYFTIISRKEKGDEGEPETSDTGGQLEKNVRSPAEVRPLVTSVIIGPPRTEEGEDKGQHQT